MAMALYNSTENSSLLKLGNISTDQLICKPFTAADSVSAQAMMTTAYCILLLLSFGGNALVILIFIRRFAHHRTPVDYFIVNMAISDLLIPLFTVPRRIQEIYLGWSPWVVGGVIGDLLCRVVNFAEEISIGVSMLSMVFIAIERFWSIMFPFKPPLITKESSPKYMIFSWFFSTLSFLYYFAAYKTIYINGRLYCRYELPELFDTWQDLWRADRITVFIIYVAVPFVLLTFLYSIIIISLHLQEKRAISLNSNQQLKRTNKTKRIAIMLMIVLCVFFVSWTPHYMYFFLQYYTWPSEQQWSCSSIKRLYLAAKYMNYLYTALNPFIYYKFNESYRQSFRALFNFRRVHVSPSADNGTPTVQQLTIQ